MSGPHAQEPAELSAYFDAFALAVRARNGLSLETWIAEHPELDAELAAELLELRDRIELLATEVVGSTGTDADEPGDVREPVPASTRRIGEFRLERPLGKGGMSEVWLARTGDGQAVALKLLLPGRYDPRALERFAREARVGGRLHHPGIVRTLGHGQDDGTAWIALEYVPGSRTLADAIAETMRAEDFDPAWYQRAARWTAGLAEALEVVHRAGLLHRDLKPTNVLLTPEGRTQLADFGLASARDEVSLTSSGERVGTIAYMSPEQVLGEELDARADVHGLGAVLYELLTLRRAFVGDSSQELANQITADEPPDARRLRAGVPRDLAVVAGKALRKERAKRYGSAREMGEDLARFLAGEPIVARPPSRWDRVQRWARRNPGRSSAGLVVVLAFLVITALLVEILRINEELAGKQYSLALANEALRAKSAEAEASASAARANETRAVQETERASSVALEAQRISEALLSLSALQNIDGLVARAASLWPCRPEMVPEYEAWLRVAHELVDTLPVHEARLAELRSRAQPFTEADLAELREGHPKLPRLESVRRKLEYLRARKAAASAPPEEDPTPAEAGLDFADLPEDASGLHTLAWPLVYPDRQEFGGERRGLLLARRALALASEPTERATIRDTVAWALYALGRFDEALLEEERAVAEVAPERRVEFQDYLARLQAAIEADLSLEGLTRTDQELEETQDELLELESEVSAPLESHWIFETSEDSWWHGQLVKLVDSLRALADPDEGLLSDGISAQHGWCMRRRLEFAAALEERSLASAAGTSWAEACRSIQDRSECLQYDGLRLSPQIGLRPLGRDPLSGLWEFADLQTGVPPERGPDGRLQLTEDTGLVFVLLPGGTFWMGAQSADPEKPNYDPGAASYEGPVQAVTLAPFFLSKYEMTQGQWLRFTGSNPSSYDPKTRFGGRQTTLLHPVEQMNWGTASTIVERLGFTLPTEAQWEYGARGGTSSAWFTGDPPESLTGAANLADSFCRDNGGPTSWIYEDWLDDGFAVHAPVGSLRPNAFGLHDVGGNVYEWCQDRFDYYSRNLPSRGDGERRVKDSNAPRAMRGGCFSDTAASLRSAYRYYGVPEFAADSLGVRPARAVTP